MLSVLDLLPLHAASIVCMLTAPVYAGSDSVNLEDTRVIDVQRHTTVKADPINNNAAIAPQKERDTLLRSQAGQNGPWYKDTETLTAIGSVGAVVIALVALVISYRGQSSQTNRELRQEMRGVLDRVVSIQAELAEISHVKNDEYGRSFASGNLNTKRTLYLEAAESIASQIPSMVGATEYLLIGQENASDLDYRQALMYYELAVERARKSAAPVLVQAQIQRYIAHIYFTVADPEVNNIDKGRKSYQEAIRVLANRPEQYMNYLRALAYGDWANNELYCKNYAEAGTLVDNAYAEWQSADTWPGYRGNDYRSLAEICRTLGRVYFQNSAKEGAPSIEAGRASFKKGLQILQALQDKFGITDDLITDTKAVANHDWAIQEMAAGYIQDAKPIAEQAKQVYSELSGIYALKSKKLTDIESLILQINDKINHVQTTTGQICAADSSIHTDSGVD